MISEGRIGDQEHPPRRIGLDSRFRQLRAGPIQAWAKLSARLGKLVISLVKLVPRLVTLVPGLVTLVSSLVKSVSSLTELVASFGE